MTKFGMHFSLWAPEWTTEAANAAIPEAARYGLEIIEIPLFEPAKIDLDHAKSIIRDHGLQATASLCLPEDKMAHLAPEACTKYLFQVLDAAHHIGCSMLTGVTYSALGYKTGVPPTSSEYEAVVRALKPVARRAAGLGMTFGVEPCTRFDTHILNTAAQGIWLLEQIDEPNTFVHLDTYHMNVEENGFDDGLRRAAGRSPYIHLSESHRGVPGTGTVDWELIFRTLRDTGFDGDLVIESFVSVPPQLAAALCMWRPAAPNASAVLDQGLPYLRGLATRYGF